MSNPQLSTCSKMVDQPYSKWSTQPLIMFGSANLSNGRALYGRLVMVVDNVDYKWFQILLGNRDKYCFIDFLQTQNSRRLKGKQIAISRQSPTLWCTTKLCLGDSWWTMYGVERFDESSTNSPGLSLSEWHCCLRTMSIHRQIQMVTIKWLSLSQKYNFRNKPKTTPAFAGHRRNV